MVGVTGSGKAVELWLLSVRGSGWVLGLGLRGYTRG